MRPLAAGLLALALAAPTLAQDIAEPKSGARFATRAGDMSLLGVGLRTKTFLKVKVYAIGLYVSDAALAGPLAAYKDDPGSAAFYRAVVTGDFSKQIHLKFVRDLSADQIQGAFREVLTAANPVKVNLFVNYFPEVKAGQEAVLRWAPGGVLETQVAGLGKLPIADREFASAVFGIWLGDQPVQEDIKKGLVLLFAQR